MLCECATKPLRRNSDADQQPDPGPLWGPPELGPGDEDATLQKQKLLQPRPQGQAQPRTQGITFAHRLASGQSLSLRDFATDLGNNWIKAKT
jgi:hypothetical protein